MNSADFWQNSHTAHEAISKVQRDVLHRAARLDLRDVQTMLTVEPTRLPEVKLIRTRRFEDERGFLSEVWNRERFAQAGIDCAFMQINHSMSRRAGTLRGLHFQADPFAQDKLVRVAHGRVLDVAVDLRVGSPRFGEHVAVELSAGDGAQLLVPAGFAHGFCTLEPDTEVTYQVTARYAPDHDRGLAFDDPALAIPWPFATDALILSDKDRRHPRLADLPAYFTWPR